MSEQKDIATALVRSLAEGVVDASLLDEDCKVWTASGREPMPGAMLCRVVPVLKSLFADDFAMEIDSVIEEGDRVAVMSHSAGTLKDGPRYENLYHYAIRFRGGRICEIGEYMNTAIVDELIRPRLRAAMAG